MDKFRAIKIFKSVVEAGNYTAAARQLELSASHISKTINELEELLGVRLLNRTTRQVQPTDVGLAYYDSCRRIVDEVEKSELAVGAIQQQLRGSIRVLGPKTIAILDIVPAICDFNNLYPSLEIELYLLDQLQSRIENGFDLALRFGEQPDSGLACRRVCLVTYLACATPTYLETHGTPRHPSDLTGHECLRNLLTARDSRWHFEAQTGGPIAVEVRGRFSANTTLLLREAVLRGSGIGILPAHSVRRELTDGVLQQVLTDYHIPALPLYAVYPHRRHLSAKIRIFIEFLAKRLTMES
jgi:DNA-binding transcriptional LysR family regulator